MQAHHRVEEEEIVRTQLREIRPRGPMNAGTPRASCLALLASFQPGNSTLSCKDHAKKRRNKFQCTSRRNSFSANKK